MDYFYVTTQFFQRRGEAKEAWWPYERQSS